MSTKEIIHIEGVAVWPHLTKPDTKWKEEGEYHTKLRIDADTAEPLLARLEAMQEQELKVAQKKAKGKKAKPADLPIQPEYDDEGEETGSYILKAGMKASGTSRKTGQKWQRKLPLFDGKGKPAPSSVAIYSGSVLHLAVEPKAWTNPKAEVGVKLYLEAAQIINLVNGSGSSANTFGFGEVEGADEIHVPDEPANDNDEIANDNDDDQDFASEEDYDFA